MELAVKLKCDIKKLISVEDAEVYKAAQAYLETKHEKENCTEFLKRMWYDVFNVGSIR